MVQARGLGDTSLVVDIYGQGNLLGSEEAKEVMSEFQAVTDLVDLEAQEMVFTDVAASGSLEMIALSRAAHRNCTIRFVRYGCMGKTPIPSRLQIYKLTAVIFTAINRIYSVNFSRITALYGYTGG